MYAVAHQCSAWHRAALLTISLLGLVAHTLYLSNLANAAQSAPLSSPAEWLLLAAWVLVIVYLGAIVNLLSARRFMRLVGDLNRDQFADRSLSRQGVIVACFLALLGIAMTIYLTLFLAQPVNVLPATFAGMTAGK